MPLIFVLAIGLTWACCGTISAQESQTDHSHPLPGEHSEKVAGRVGPHGGSLKMAGNLKFETLVDQTGIQMFAFDSQGSPVSVERGRGAAVLRVEGNAKRYRYDLLPDGKGGLLAPVNLSRIAGRQIEIDITLVGVGTTDVRFNEVATVPANQMQLAAAAIARQRLCPVSGKPLGSMGGPVKLMVGDKPIFLCCRGCIKKVQSEPAKYLAKVDGDRIAESVPVGSEKVREGIYKVTSADAHFIAAQKKCPVMDEPLDAMGGPYKVHANGKAVYICCPGCAKRIAAEPEKYLAVLNSRGVTPPTLR